MATTLNQSKQNFRAIGFVNETNLVQESCEIKMEDGSTEQGERIRGKVSVRMGNNVKTFDVFCNSITTKGDESKQWKNALSWLELNPEIGGNPDISPSVVSVNGRVTENRYFNENTKDVSVALRWTASRISTSRVTEEDEQGCTLSGNFYINSIKPETKDDEETGRLLVGLCGVQYGASPFVIDAIVEEDLAETFTDMYEVGQTASFDIDVVFEHIGAKTGGKKAFCGGGKIKSTGYDKEILVIVGGDAPIEESEEEDDDGNIIDNGYIDPKAMKTALKERANAIAEIKSNGGTTNKTASKTSNLKEKKRSLGKKVTPPVEDEDDDDPFDEDDDF